MRRRVDEHTRGKERVGSTNSLAVAVGGVPPCVGAAVGVDVALAVAVCSAVVGVVFPVVLVVGVLL